MLASKEIGVSWYGSMKSEQKSMMITFVLSGMEHFAMKSSTQGDPGVNGMLGTIGPEKEGSWL
jgi:hypothetical protein